MKNEIVEHAMEAFFGKMNELCGAGGKWKPIEIAEARKECPELVERFEKCLLHVIEQYCEKDAAKLPALKAAVDFWTEGRGFSPNPASKVPADHRDRVLLAAYLKLFPELRTSRERCEMCKQPENAVEGDDDLDLSLACDECPTEGDIESFIKQVSAEEAELKNPLASRALGLPVSA